jgi:hypothetical protein
VTQVSTGTKLATYALVLAGAFGVGAAAGAAFGPDPDDEPAPAVIDDPAAHDGHGG